MNVDDPPVFNYYQAISINEQHTGRMKLIKGDTIPNTCTNEDNQRIYYGSIILGLSASIFVPEDASPTAGCHLITPRFELLGCRICRS